MSGNLNLPGAPGSNTGHGHVYPRPDGSRARCGGPRLCKQCQADAARRDAPVDVPARFRAAAEVAEERGGYKVAAYYALNDLAAWCEVQPPHVVEAIWQALTGERP